MPTTAGEAIHHAFTIPSVSNGWGDGERSGRFAALLALGGAATAVVSVLLAAVAGGPYLEAEGVNVWIVFFAAGLMAALLAFPFGLEVRLRERYPDRDKRWEASLVVWGLVAGALLAIGLAAGFDTATLGGAVGVILVIESALIVATVGVWLVSGG
jgi:hypothetical protein